MSGNLGLLTKNIAIEINGKNEILSEDKMNFIKLENGSKLRISKKLLNVTNNEDLIVVKNGENLEIFYSDGSSVTLEGFYALENVSLELPTGENESHLLSSNLENASVETSVVYAQGDMSKFISLLDGNETLSTALNNYNHSLSGMNSGDAIAAGEAGASTGTFAGLSQTAMLAIGGVVVAGVAVAASSGGSSSSIDSSTSSTDSSTNQLVDSPVSGADVYVNGVYVTTTDANGYFTHNAKAGDVVTFKIANVTLGSMDASSLPTDGKILPQDIAGVDRNDTTNPAVVKMAQILQTLDSDGDAENGITIKKDENGDIVNDSNAVLLDKDTSLTITETTDDTDLTNALENAGDTALVTANDAETHLKDTVQDIILEEAGVDDIADITASNITELVALIDAGSKNIMLDGSIDLTDSGLTPEQLSSINSYTGTLVLNDFIGNSNLSLTMTLTQYNAMTVNSSGDDKVTVIATEQDAISEIINDSFHGSMEILSINMKDMDLSDADIIVIKDITNAIVKLNVSQAVKVNTQLSDGFYTVEDSLENLQGSEDLSDAASVALQLTQDTDLTEITLNNSVKFVDAEGYTLTMTVAQYESAIATYAETLNIKDTTTNLMNGSYQQYGPTPNLVITDSVSIGQLETINTIQYIGTVEYSTIADTYANLTIVDNASWFASNPDILVIDPVTVVKQAEIDALTTGELQYILADTLENLVAANSSVLDGAFEYTLTDNAGELTITTLAEAQIIDGAANHEDYTYTIALSLADLVAAETLPSTYTLSDASTNPLVLTVQEALIVGGAENENTYTYSISDTAENVTANLAAVEALVEVPVTLTDTTIAAANLNAINTGITELVTIEATTLTGSVADVKTVFTSPEGQIDGPADIAITITDAANSTIQAADLNIIADTESGTAGTVTVQNAVTVSGTAAQLATMRTEMSENLVFAQNPNLTFTDTVATVEALNATDLATTGIVTATVTFTTVTEALTLNANNNVYSIDLVTISLTPVELDSLNSIYTTISGTITVLATIDEQDLTLLDLTNATTIDVGNIYVEATLEQALKMTTTQNSSYSIWLPESTENFVLADYLLPNGLLDLMSNNGTAQTITIGADSINSNEDHNSDFKNDLYIYGDSADSVILDVSYISAGTLADPDYKETFNVYTNTNGSVFINLAISNIVVSGTLSTIDALDTLPASYILTDEPGELNLTVEQVSILNGANNADAYTYSISDAAALIAANVGANPDYVSGTTAVTLLDGVAATVTEMKTINDATSGAITLNTQTIAADYSDTAANLVAAFDGITTLTGTITVTDGVTIAQLTALELNTGATITGELSDTSTALVGADGTNVSTYIIGDIDVNMTGASTTAQITAVDTANGAGGVFVAEYELSGDLSLASLYNLSGFDVNLLAEINTTTDTGVNNLTITLADVLAIGEDLDLTGGIIDTNGSDNVKDILITKETQDTVNLDAGWSTSTTLNVNSITYNVYTNTNDVSVALYISNTDNVVIA